MKFWELGEIIFDCIPDGCYSKFGTVVQDMLKFHEEVDDLQFEVIYVLGDAEVDSADDKIISEFTPKQEFAESDVFKVFNLVNDRLCRIYTIEADDDGTGTKVFVKFFFV